MTAQAHQSSNSNSSSRPKRSAAERLAARFLHRRRQDPSCDARSFLEESTDILSRGAGEIVEVLAIEQDDRWRRGQRPPAETFLSLHQTFAPLEETAFDLIYAEYLLREELGETPDLEEFLWRFPDWSQPLRDQIALSQALGADAATAMTQSPPLNPLSPGATALESTLPFNGDGCSERDADHEGAFRPPGFDVLEEIGRGAMGVVYRARQKSPERLVALKAFRGGQLATAGDRERFGREAELAARLQHPHFVQIFDVRVHDDQPYMVLEFVDGVNLAEAMEGVPLHPKDAAALTATLARAMHEAHLKGVLHRDLKPSNVLLAGPRDGPIGARQAKITDFGLAKRLDVESPHGATISGDVIGTPCYMAPEQALGHSRKAGPAADVYSLGALLYEMLTGRPPFRADTAVHVLQQVVTDDPLPPRQLVPGLAADLETICLRCLRKAPEQRYLSALAMAEDLERYLQGEPIRARKALFWERSLRGIRRQPLVAALSLGLASAALFGVASLALAWRIAAQRAFDEHIGRQHAEISERDARASAKRLGETLYGYRIAQAISSWDGGDRERFGELLDQAATGPSGEDYRGWEWFALDRRRRAPILGIPVESRFRVEALALADDGEGLRIAAGLNGSTPEIRIWSWDSDQNRLEPQSPLSLNAESGSITALAFAADGSRLAAAQGRSARYWERGADRESGSLRFPESSSAIRALAFDPSGDRVFAGDDQGTVYSVNVADGRIISQRALGLGPIRALTVPPALSSRLLAATDGGIASLSAVTLEMAADAPIRSLRLGNPASCWALGPDGDTVAVGTDRQWRMLSTSTNSDPASSQAYGGSSKITALAFAPDGVRIVAAERDQGIRAWDSTQGRDGDVLARSPEDLAACGLESETETGRLKVHALGRSGRLRTYDAHDGSLIDNTFFEGMRDLSTFPEQAAISPSGRLLAFATQPDGRVVFVLPTSSNVDDPTRRTLALDAEEPVAALAFAPDDSALAAWIPTSRSVRVWSLNDGKERRTLSFDNANAVVSFKFAPDGRSLAIATTQGVLQLADLETGEARWRSRIEIARNPESPAIAMAFDPRLPRLAVANSDGAIQLIDATTGAMIRRWVDAAGADDLAFLTGDQRLAVSHRDGVRIWDPATGQALLSLRFPDDGPNAATGPIQLRGSDDDRLAAIRGGSSRVIGFWNGSPGADRIAATPDRLATRLLTEAEAAIEARDYAAARSRLRRLPAGALNAAIESWRQSLLADIPPSLP